MFHSIANWLSPEPTLHAYWITLIVSQELENGTKYQIVHRFPLPVEGISLNELRVLLVSIYFPYADGNIFYRLPTGEWMELPRDGNDNIYDVIVAQDKNPTFIVRKVTLKCSKREKRSLMMFSNLTLKDKLEMYIRETDKDICLGAKFTSGMKMALVLVDHGMIPPPLKSKEYIEKKGFVVI